MQNALELYNVLDYLEMGKHLVRWRSQVHGERDGLGSDPA